MKKILLSIVTLFLISQTAISQKITEKELFKLKYKGNAEAYSFKQNKSGSSYCYVYTIRDQNKSFIISDKSTSEKYDYTDANDIRFDKNGNYYTVTSDYDEQYGLNNYFLIMNGKEIKNYNYIESYSAYINKKNEAVFIFKENEKYRIGFYNPESGFRQSESYDNIRAVFNDHSYSGKMEGDILPYNEDYFFKNIDGERAFLAATNGKTKIIFETSVLQTDYSDINETSLCYNKNNELSYIAKKGGRFYELAGNEFVVSGKTEYDKFELVGLPLLFNNQNEPVYIAGDSVTEDKYNYNVILGNQKLKGTDDAGSTSLPPDIGSSISEIRIADDGGISYVTIQDGVIPSAVRSSDGSVYDDYYSKYFYVKDGNTYELGYNLNKIKISPAGDLLYSGNPEVSKKERVLMMNDGSSRIIINKNNFDDVYEYGFSPAGEIYFAAQNYEDSLKNKKNETVVYVGDKFVGTYSFIAYQYFGDSSSLMAFDTKNNFAFSAEVITDQDSIEYIVVTGQGKLPFPSNISNSKKFNYISYMMFTKDDKLFYAADMSIDPVTYQITKEIFIDNKSLGKTYTDMSDFSYDKSRNEISFNGCRNKKIYSVKISL